MDLTSKFSLKRIADVLEKPLSEINNLKLLTEDVSRDVSYERDDYVLSAEGEAALDVYLFNDADDDNDDALAAALELDEAIEKGNAFLSYHLKGKVKGGLKGETNYAALHVEKVREVIHCSYLKHSCDELLGDAVTNDVKHFKLAIDRDDVLSLENYEALSIATTGVLDVNASLSVADTFTPMLSGIGSILGTTDTLGVTFSMSASFDVGIQIADDFEVVIQRRDKGNQKQYAVTIRRDSTRSRTMTAALGVDVSVTNPGVLMKVIDAIIDGGEKNVLARIERLEEKAWDSLSTREKAFVEKASNSIGLDYEKIKDNLFEKYKAKRDEVTEKIAGYVEAGLKFSVAHTYEKTVEKQSLLKCVLKETAMKRCFEDVIRFQATKVYNDLKKTPGDAAVLEYADLTRISIARSFKIGVSVGDFELSQQVKRTVEFEDQLMYDGGNKEEVQLVNFNTTSFTAEKLGIFKQRENSLSITGSYQGERRDVVRMADLDFGFSLQWSETFKTLKAYQLKEVVDFAVTWGILDEASSEEKLEELSEVFGGRKRVKVSAFLSLKEGAFDALINPLATLGEYAFCRALAASLPYADYDGRSVPSDRADLYYSFFVRYLKERSGSTIDYDKEVSDVISQHLIKNERKSLAEFERNGDNRYETLASVLEHNFMPFQFKRFRIAIEKLNDDRKDFRSVLKSPEFTRNLHSFRLQPDFNMRFMGRLVWELCRERGIEDVLGRSLVVDWKDDKGEDQRYVLAK